MAAFSEKLQSHECVYYYVKEWWSNTGIKFEGDWCEYLKMFAKHIKCTFKQM